MRTSPLLILSALAAVTAASAAFTFTADPTVPAAAPAAPPTQVQAAQVDAVIEAAVIEDTTPRPVLRGGAPDGDVGLVPPRPPADEPAPEPALEPTPEPTPEAATSSAWTGVASWYGDEFAGRSTASGATFDPNALTAAHRTLAFGTQVRVTLQSTGQSVVVTINDRGPYSGGREIDLSRAAADAIGLTSQGTGTVTLEVV